MADILLILIVAITGIAVITYHLRMMNEQLNFIGWLLIQASGLEPEVVAKRWREANGSWSE